MRAGLVQPGRNWSTGAGPAFVDVKCQILGEIIHLYGDTTKANLILRRDSSLNHAIVGDGPGGFDRHVSLPP